jgi:hypothetical protein
MGGGKGGKGDQFPRPCGEGAGRACAVGAESPQNMRKD